MKLETIAIKAGGEPDAATGAVSPPIHMSTIFAREKDGTLPAGYSYGRDNNPTRVVLETRLAALEGGREAIAFASGSAAAMSLFQALAPGDHLVAPVDVYHGVRVISGELMRDWGLEVSFVDMTDPDKVAAAIRDRTRLVFVDTPSNPLLEITDIAEVARLAHARGALVAVDNTFATPILQRPLQLGADLVVHATTKYIGGHSDVTGGAVVVGAASAPLDALAARIRRLQRVGGAVPSPFDAWLLARGLATLPYRMRAHAEHAAKIAEALTRFPSIAQVIYPGLASHRGHAVAKRQMSAFGGMISFRVRGGRDAALAALARLTLLVRATSLGGVESTIEHRKTSEGPLSPTPDDLLRLSVGLEHPDDVIEDLRQALGG